MGRCTPNPMTVLFACFPVCLMFVGLTIVAILVVVFGMANTAARSEASTESVAAPPGQPAHEEPPPHRENVPLPPRPNTQEPSSNDTHAATTATGPPPLGIILVMALLAFLAALVLMWFGWNEGM